MDILQYNNKKAVLSTALTQINDLLCFLIVGVVRLERTTTCTPCKYASQLRYTPIHRCHPFQMTMQR